MPRQPHAGNRYNKYPACLCCCEGDDYAERFESVWNSMTTGSSDQDQVVLITSTPSSWFSFRSPPPTFLLSSHHNPFMPCLRHFFPHAIVFPFTLADAHRIIIAEVCTTTFSSFALKKFHCPQTHTLFMISLFIWFRFSHTASRSHPHSFFFIISKPHLPPPCLSFPVPTSLILQSVLVVSSRYTQGFLFPLSLFILYRVCYSFQFYVYRYICASIQISAT